jgi:hypothetical protein
MLSAAVPVLPAGADRQQALERTCLQTGAAYSDAANLRSGVAIVYGIDPRLPERIQTWRNRGYRIHVMTGVSWGNYQDYLYGRYDGVNHEDEAQTDRQGNKISHGGDVYYMCPGENYGRYFTVGVERALAAGAEAIHLEEPEFWVRGGYSEGFKREWKRFYGEDWMPPHASVDAQGRASKLKYHLYRRALQEVFDFIQDYNRKHGRAVRWDCGTRGVGVRVSDSLMFQRGEPAASDPHLSHFYGLALPLLKRGLPVTPLCNLWLRPRQKAANLADDDYPPLAFSWSFSSEKASPPRRKNRVTCSRSRR